MIKKLLIIIVVVFGLGLGIMGIGLAIDTGDSRSTVVGGIAEGVTDERSDSMELEPFESIELSVKAADIIVRTGDKYAVTYKLSSREWLNRCEVSDGVFFFHTNIDTTPNLDFVEGEIIVTVPDTADLKALNLKTISGDVTVSDRKFESGSFESTSGSLELSALNGKALELSSVSGDIELDLGEVGTLSAESVSGSIKADGSFEELSFKTVSGDCDVKGSVSREAQIKTTSGDIDADIPVESVSARSHGGVSYMGKNQGRKLELDGGEPLIVADSVSGKIEIQGN